MSRTIAVAALGVVALAVAGCGDAERANTDQADSAVLATLEAQIGAIEADVVDMADREAILDNELEYTRGLDRHDESLMSNVFWPDAAISYGSRVSVAELPAWANAGHSNSAAHQHHVTTLWLDIDGDTAHEEGDILFSSDMPRDKALDTAGEPTPGRAMPGKMTTLGTGRYVNRYEKRNGDWRLIVHEYVNDVSMLLEPVDLCATGCLGTWNTADISYLRPLQPLSVDERRARAEIGTMPHARPSNGAN